MCKDAVYDYCDIPICPTTARKIPQRIITWVEAKSIYKKHITANDTYFYVDAFVCWYIDDYKFDGMHGIWNNSNFVLKVLSHFAGAITPDFSTYQDFPEALKLYNTYRMRAFGYWLGKNDVQVINNVRWGTPETYKYSFSGLPLNSVVSIGTSGGSPFKLKDKKRFQDGLEELVKKINPHTIIVYGSANYPCLKKLQTQGIKITSYPSQMALAFEKRNTYE